MRISPSKMIAECMLSIDAKFINALTSCLYLFIIGEVRMQLVVK